jgi:hypothetical protein
VARAEAAEAALAAAEADAARSKKGPLLAAPYAATHRPGGQCARAVCYPLAQAYPLAAWFDTDTERALARFDDERGESPRLVRRGERREERGESPRRVVAAWLPKRAVRR